MMWDYGMNMGWTMWLWGILLLVGTALLVVVAVRLFGAGRATAAGGAGLWWTASSRFSPIAGADFTEPDALHSARQRRVAAWPA
ncbi:hypothetical protein [Arthrobacter sp. UYEF6]|uniref:hypothetical protein n=1 Tax=unclassified Pseudarthrobacter TaxID=2647000 RepID=UPI003390D0D9